MSIVVVCRSDGVDRQYLVLRAAGAEGEGDWVWRPPSGSIEPGESEHECAVRELFEETGLRGELRAVDDMQYPTFFLEVPANATVRLSHEHQEHQWVTAEELVPRCRPAEVSDGLAAALVALGHVT